MSETPIPSGMPHDRLDLAGPAAPAPPAVSPPYAVGIYPDNEKDVDLLLQLLIAECDRQDINRGELNVGRGTICMALALRRLGAIPDEPHNLAARVTGTRTDPDNDIPVTYAKVGDVWVSPADGAGRSWDDLAVEYDNLTIDVGERWQPTDQAV